MIECVTCSSHCCGSLPGVRPILMPWEDRTKYRTERHGPLVLVKKRRTGLCIHFDQKGWETGQGGCKVYEQRPLECRLYPLVLDLQHMRLVLDPRAPCGETYPVTAGLLAAAFEAMAGFHKMSPEWMVSYLHHEG